MSGPSIAPPGLVETGDLGFEDDGELVVVGRRDDVIICAGRNFVGATLEAGLNAVAEPEFRRNGFAVLADDGGYSVVAELASATSDVAPASGRRLRAAARDFVGANPKRIVVVAPRTLPRTPSGKLRRHLAVALLAPGHPSALATLDRS